MDEKVHTPGATEVSSDLKAPIDAKNSVNTISEEDTIGTSEEIYIDPAKEAACRANFDKYVVPVSVIFLVLSTLDRNNVSLNLFVCDHH
jgi:hypothetical protein